jgi:hypothetical protein
LEGTGSLFLRIPAPVQGSSLLKADSVIRALQSKIQRLECDLEKELDKMEDSHRLATEVQRLEGALSMEEERTTSLVADKKKYKNMVMELRDLAKERISFLEVAVEKGEVSRLELQKKLEEAQLGAAAELERLRPMVEEFQKEKVRYEEWRDTGLRRMELAQDLARAEEDQKQFLLHVLELEREAKEHAR